ncbi:MAG: hypothetical protein BWK75_04510 [Candidatus Altiarchaeales archaeon A3]|nr:MAG: hypothetical protein BWK75_04510 [Candidatus Altiarchaeales archaeon A3]
MPKTYKNLFVGVCSFENLHDAYLKAMKGRGYKDEVIGFSYNLEENLFRIKAELETQTYKPDAYKEFYIYDSKKRLIKAPSFRDRVVHHALCNVIEPVFDKTFIYDSYACRKGKGTHKGVDQLQKFIRKTNEGYALKCDVVQYFPGIDHETLLEIIDRKIKDEKVMWLADVIIRSSETSAGSKKGLPIGNLTSQLFANIYLNELDYFVKHKLKIKNYVRYVDDFVILQNKQKLCEIKTQVIEFLRTLKLEIHSEKANIFPVKHGIDFLGYGIFHSHRLLRKANVEKFTGRLKVMKNNYQRNLSGSKRIWQSIVSWIGHAKHADTYGLRKKIFGENPFVFDVYEDVK